MRIKDAKKFDTKDFINRKIKEISDTVGNGIAISALSGGVDSSTTTLLGYRALGERLKTYFIDDGLMRENEPQKVIEIFRKLGVKVKIIDAREQFFNALKGITDPEAKRECITQTFYRDVFSKLIKESGAKYLLQGTILTDIEETVAGIKRQHNVFEQLGINPQEAFGYKIIEPIKELRKDGVRKVAKALGLPEELRARIPFPGPGLATRVIGEVTPEKIELVRKATSIVEEELARTKAFQYLAVLHEDRVTGIKEGKRKFGYQIEVRCWESKDARVATPTKLHFEILEKLARRIVTELPEVVSVTYNITPKPPSTIEAV
ncbi:MAG: ExsB family transcriptional regulator [Candidatus Thermoplasmatota archaeon]